MGELRKGELPQDFPSVLPEQAASLGLERMAPACKDEGGDALGAVQARVADGERPMQGHVHGDREGLLAQMGEEQMVDRLDVKRIHKAAPLLNLKVCSEDKAAARRACLRGRLWDLDPKACLWDLAHRSCLWAYPRNCEAMFASTSSRDCAVASRAWAISPMSSWAFTKPGRSSEKRAE